MRTLHKIKSVSLSDYDKARIWFFRDRHTLKIKNNSVWYFEFSDSNWYTVDNTFCLEAWKNKGKPEPDLIGIAIE